MKGSSSFVFKCVSHFYALHWTYVGLLWLQTEHFPILNEVSCLGKRQVIGITEFDSLCYYLQRYAFGTLEVCN